MQTGKEQGGADTQTQPSDKGKTPNPNDAQSSGAMPPVNKGTSENAKGRGRTGRWWWTHGLPMYGIVLTLLFIAVQPLILPLVSEWRKGDIVHDVPRHQVENSTPVLAQEPGGGVATANPGGDGSNSDMNLKTDGDARSIAAVARLSLDGNRERIEGMKETYDRLFAMIATLGALLAFLGFKGFESFMQARDDAQETVERSKGAVLEAEGAKTQADAALKELHQFLRVDYPKDNSAEINVAHGLVMREIAVLYSCMAEKMGKDIKDFPEYREVLHLSLVYLNKVRLQADRLDKRVIARALITIGNVESLLGNSRGALEACQEVIEKHSPDDESAHFNAACYACRLGAEEAAKESHKTAKAYADLSIARLTRAIELLPSNRLDASTDKDFVWLREQGNPAFMSLLAEP